MKNSGVASPTTGIASARLNDATSALRPGKW